jgi:hypothetical protein
METLGCPGFGGVEFLDIEILGAKVVTRTHNALQKNASPAD